MLTQLTPIRTPVSTRESDVDGSGNPNSGRRHSIVGGKNGIEWVGRYGSTLCVQFDAADA